MKANTILEGARQKDSIKIFADENGYVVRRVQMIVKEIFGSVTYKRISSYYVIAETIALIKKGNTVQNAYLTVKGSDNTSPYYKIINAVNAQTPWQQERFLEAMVVIDKIAESDKPITLKELKCKRSLIVYIRHTLGYRILSKPGAGYYFGNLNDKTNCLKWINDWRSSVGLLPNFTM